MICTNPRTTTLILTVGCLLIGYWFLLSKSQREIWNCKTWQVLHPFRPSSNSFSVGRRLPADFRWNLSHVLTNVEHAENVCPLRERVRAMSAISRKRSRSIMGGKTMAFIGDSRMRDIFCFLRSLLQGHTPKNYTAFYHDVIFRQFKHNITLLFYWRRFPDSELQRLLARWQLAVEEVPHYIIVQIGAWSVDRFGGTDIANFTSGVGDAMIKLNSLPCDRTTSIWMQTLPVNPTTSWPSWVKRNNASMYVELFGQWIRKTLAHHAISSHPTTPKGTPSTVLLWSTAHDVALKRLVMYRDHVHPGILLVQQFVCQLLTAIGVFGERTNVQEAHAQP